MMQMNVRGAALLAMFLPAACGGGDAELETAADTTAAQCDEVAARDVVGRLGQRLKDVPLLAPDTILRAAMREAYEPLVTPALLDEWLANPADAPGRHVSSPWPDRIEILSVTAEAPGTCLVEGNVLHVTSADTTAESALRSSAVITVRETDGWRVSEYRVQDGAGSGSPPDSDGAREMAPSDTGGDAAAATRVIEQYYEAIDARDYPRAWSLWSDSGRASGQTLSEFGAGFAETSSVRVDVGAPGRIEGAAGSRFVSVPVTIEAIDSAGRRSFAGTYTLRRSVVDGATREQRSWRIHSAEIAQR
jgi:hypothetical protein